VVKLVSSQLWDSYSFDLSWYHSNLSSQLLSGKTNIVVNGMAYKDEYVIRASDEYFDLELQLLGSGLTQNADGKFTSGTVNFIGERENINKNLLWYAEGLAINAPALHEVVKTPSTQDDFAFLVSALSGDDTIILSPFADRMSGFEGNDIITGGLGRDYLEGGGGNDTFLDTKAGLDGDVFADFGRGDRIIITDATFSEFRFNLSGSTLSYTGGTLTFGSALNAGMVASASVNGGVVLELSNQFADPSSVPLNNFLATAGGWSSQDRFPRHIADVNGDGFSDIVGFGQAGVMVSFGSANGSFSGAALALADFGFASGWTSDNHFHRELVDVNGDGRADIVGFGIAGALVSLARADGTFSKPTLGILDFGTNQGWAAQNGLVRTVGDVNGDGRADIVGFSSAGTMISLGNGDGTFSSISLDLADFGVQQGWTSDDQFHRTLADVNGDGSDDIIGFGTAGTWVALAKGDGTFKTPLFAIDNFGKDQGWSSQNSFTRDVADVNGDGYADVVGFGYAGTYVAYGNANGSFSSPQLDVVNFGANQGWTSDSSYHRQLADLNNDGTMDIVGFGQTGVLASYNHGPWLL
jgi:hypothetical protein